MPELPEVETIIRKLKPILVNRSFQTINVLHPKSFHGDTAQLLNTPITDITRRAKIIRLTFANDLHLLIHLKMTGQLIYVQDGQRLGGGHPTADWVRQLPSTHTRVSMALDNEAQLFFNDQRLFGWLKITTNEQYQQLINTLGPDVNSDEFTLEYFSQHIAHRGIPIKVAIMDNAIVCGVGNIYACDALNHAHISPFRPAKSLSSEEQQQLFESMKFIIDEGIRLGGTTTDGKYVDVHGFAGGYQEVCRVYGRAGQPCPNCGGIIQKKPLAGRGTYFCPECQK